MIKLPIPDTECLVDEVVQTPLAKGELVTSFVFRDGDAIEVCFDDVGTYRIEDGRRLSIRPAPDVSEDLIAFYLRATPFGLLVLQRGELPFHASAMVPPRGGGAVLVAGDSGAGKSTTAGLLARAGWRVLNDDISRITRRDGVLVAWPGFQTLKLGDHSLALLDLGNASLPRTPAGRDKAFWEAQGITQPVPVLGMVILDEPLAPARAPRRLAGLELLEGLYRQTFRPHLVKPLGLHAAHFRNLTDFAREVPVVSMAGNQTRPASELVAVIVELAAAWSGAGA